MAVNGALDPLDQLHHRDDGEGQQHGHTIFSQGDVLELEQRGKPGDGDDLSLIHISEPTRRS